MNPPKEPGLLVDNPLPVALRSYQDDLAGLLEEVGVRAKASDVPSIEVAGRGKTAKVLAAWHGFWYRQHADRDWARLVLWPAFGYLEPLAWAGRGRRRAPVAVVYHDPEPLRAQNGLGARAAVLGRRRAARDGMVTVAHSKPAAAALADRGWPGVVVLPIPGSDPSTTPDTRTADPRTVTVLGQHKTARSLDQLATVADAVHATTPPDGPPYRLLVAGRGWPDVPCWTVDPSFMTEEEFQARLDEALVLVVPYARFFQSGVAVRALSSLVPVVSLRHPFLEDLYGFGWPGLVDEDTVEGWRDALVGAAAATRADLERIRADYRARCVKAWTAALPGILGR